MEKGRFSVCMGGEKRIIQQPCDKCSLYRACDKRNVTDCPLKNEPMAELSADCAGIEGAFPASRETVMISTGASLAQVYKDEIKKAIEESHGIGVMMYGA